MPRGRKKKFTGEILRGRFCKNLKRMMKERAIDNSRLAEIMGLSATEIWRYAEGQTYPNVDRLAFFCQVFQVEPMVFLEDPRKCLAITPTSEI